MKYPIKSVLYYRSHIMFFAALWILCSHSISIVGAEQWSFLLKLKPLIAFGWGGVDIFFFLSGLGIGLSLSKQPKFSTYLSKRFNRIWFPFFLIVTIEHVMNNTKTISYLLDVSTLSYWLPLLGEHSKNTFWYISAAFAFYLISYPYHALFCRRPLLSTILISILGLVLYKLFFGKIDFFLGRVPIYFIGMYASRWVNVSFKSFPFIFIGLLSYCLMALVAWRYGGLLLSEVGLHFILFIAIAPGIVLFLANLFEFINKYKWGALVNRICNKLGKYSLEIYLVHWTFLCMIKQFEWEIPWIIFVVVSIAIACILQFISNYLLQINKIMCKV
ncbi:acyltransferase [Barnesiella sp. ET7]|uniref:acyltransferase family protein n=1 Tax=Barnesiella sp. ET7 TaxID=2972460 RepID=UPI0021AD44D0|nr:acyltransferase [Barnesiella sp. ET7]MCR8912779.1 acyltransferase [Barnesiella sp. ET7]